jgi:putative peptidoglycan lipid II flippase
VTSNSTSANRQIARAAGTVMLAFVFSQLTGLARGIIVARAFGASAELDAFFAANRVSETLFTLIAGGALGSAFIPAFTGLLAKNERDSAWRLAYGVANLVTLTLSLLAVIAAFAAPQIVRYALAPGLSQDPVLFTLTINLLRIQLVSAVLFGLGGLIVGVLNAHQIFLIPALTPALYQIGIIFGALVLAPTLGIYGLAWGVVIGAALYLLVQIPTLLKLTANRRRQTVEHPLPPAVLSPLTYLGLDNPAVREVLRLMGPRLLGMAVVQLNFWVNIALASQMDKGSVSGLTYGFSLMLMAQAAIAQSIAIAAMPTFSAQYALGKTDEMRSALAATLRGVILLSLPAAVGLMLLRTPLISALYQRGQFDSRSTELVAWALLWYAAGLVGHAILEILARAFYALHDTKTPVLVGAGAMGLNVAFSFLFSALFRQIGWMPLGGLALANSLATAIEAVILFALMQRRLNGIHGADVTKGLGQAFLAALGMAIGLLAWMQASGSLNRWVIALGGVAIGGIIYGLGAVLLKVPELQIVFSMLRKRLSGSHRPH